MGGDGGGTEGKDTGSCGKTCLVLDMANYSPSLACARNTKQSLGR